LDPTDLGPFLQAVEDFLNSFPDGARERFKFLDSAIGAILKPLAT
jgi:hypothetical protein